MKAGLVVTIRVNPRDCQSVLDLLDKVGYPRNGLTFSQCVSLALGSMLETARMNEILPEPDPFAFLQRIAPYQGLKGNRHRLASAISDAGAGFRARGLSKAKDYQPAAPTQPETSGAPEEAAPQAAATDVEVARFTELLQKSDMGKLTPTEQAEYGVLEKMLYPDG